MRKIIFVLFVFILAVLALYYYLPYLRSNSQKSLTNHAPANMNLSSSVFENNTSLPSKYTCDGESISPPLRISDIPENAQSLVLISDDPDAPGGIWVHWLVWNIDPAAKEIAEGSVPSGAVEGTTSFGKTGYGAPCPPSGTHRYFFRLYALDSKLNLSPETDKKRLEKSMEGHILDQVCLVATYSRQQ